MDAEAPGRWVGLKAAQILGPSANHDASIGERHAANPVIPAANEVAVGHDADQPVVDDDGERSDAGGVHQLRRLTDGPVRADSEPGAVERLDRSHDDSSGCCGPT